MTGGVSMPLAMMPTTVASIAGSSGLEVREGKSVRQRDPRRGPELQRRVVDQHDRFAGSDIGCGEIATSSQPHASGAQVTRADRVNQELRRRTARRPATWYPRVCMVIPIAADSMLGSRRTRSGRSRRKSSCAVIRGRLVDAGALESHGDLEQSLRVESRIARAEHDVAASSERGSSHQDDRQSDLHDDEHAPRASPLPTAASEARLLQRVIERSFRSVNRRHQSKQQTTDNRQPDANEKNGHVNRNCRFARDVSTRNQEGNESRQHDCQPHSNHTSSRGEDKVLDQQLPEVRRRVSRR